ncbi:hypothetical protein A2917_03320 [Candidatus Nomurabacteria bacterium RIFCSPLOWO2_01_FULL_42_17]|uniref:DUF5667 domain-containing protein n=1 Tax=Candidatus Nomurabacteria bacterium RIFCSPLOWO2_01_FULL_42_17 TaxID=1801780 RepID=A0A1F6XN72_9BACT|nr:MAG: hypothetical protein A2917_03320 [Candidatus Nomurabacteria bacterium RIFCSPLOWO2_01_FULL_42_17]
MKKYLGFSVGLFVVLAMTFIANTQTAKAEISASVEARIKAKADFKITRQALEAEIKTKREESKKKIEDLRAQIKTERDVMKAKMKEERIVGRERALHRFDGAVERMSNLTNKVEANITKLSGKGVDVTIAENLVATAELKLTGAKDKIAEANALLSASSDELTAENKTALRTLAKDIQALIKETHQALREAIKSLKDAVKIKMEAEMKVEAETL